MARLRGSTENVSLPPPALPVRVPALLLLHLLLHVRIGVSAAVLHSRLRRAGIRGPARFYFVCYGQDKLHQNQQKPTAKLRYETDDHEAPKDKGKLTEMTTGGPVQVKRRPTKNGKWIKSTRRCIIPAHSANVPQSSLG